VKENGFLVFGEGEGFRLFTDEKGQGRHLLNAEKGFSREVNLISGFVRGNEEKAPLWAILVQKV